MYMETHIPYWITHRVTCHPPEMTFSASLPVKVSETMTSLAGYFRVTKNRMDIGQ